MRKYYRSNSLASLIVLLGVPVTAFAGTVQNIPEPDVIALAAASAVAIALLRRYRKK